MKKIMLIIVLLSTSAFTQNSFTVNSYSDSTQRAPLIINYGNEFVVFWQSIDQSAAGSGGDILAKKIDTNGNSASFEEIINDSTSYDQERHDAAPLSNGKIAVTWASHSGKAETIFDVKYKILDADLTGSPEQRANTFLSNSQTKPAIAASPNGGFVIVWESWDQDGSDKGIYARLFDNDGNPVSEEFLVNETTLNSQGRPDVAYLSNGNIVVIWESWRQDKPEEPGYGIYGRIFNPQGISVSAEFNINSYLPDYQWFGNLAPLAEGGFVAAWVSWEQDKSDGGIYLQKFDENGLKIGSEVRANKTSAYYQWLPVVKALPSGHLAVVWSSWLQDGSREGIYARYFDQDLYPVSFEQQININTEGYQWEPDFAVVEGDNILVVWADWVSDDMDYEITGVEFSPYGPQGTILTSSYIHSAGNSTAYVFVHVVDSTAVTGNSYIIDFPQASSTSITAEIKEIPSGIIKVSDFIMDRGISTFYLTNIFDGVAVEIIPEYNFELNYDRSKLLNNTGGNISFTISKPGGNFTLAPIDAALIFGNPDTISGGNYAFPLDTAYSSAGIKEVLTPFIAYNLTDNEKIRMFISEPNATKNKRWDPGEAITLLTPPQYDPAFPKFHCQINTFKPALPIMPDAGDTLMVFTRRPVSQADTFSFSTNPTLITSANNFSGLFTFELNQNYPNPFNPTTTISFSLDKPSFVSLSVYNILGEKIEEIFKGIRESGYHRFHFSGDNLSSGMYIYRLETGSRTISRKMMLIK